MTNGRSGLWRMIILAIGAVALFGLAVAAACGGDDDGGGDGDGDGDATPTATADGDGDGDGDGNGDGNGDGDGDGDFLSQIEDFADEYEDASGVVTYTFSSEGETGEWTVYAEGDSSRVDVKIDDAEFISINTPDVSYTCIEDVCFEGEGGVGANPYEGFFTSFASASAIAGYLGIFADVDVDSSSEEIAGVDADCFTVSGSLVDDEGTIKWCWSESGLLLLAQYNLTSGDFEIRATDFSDSVPDDAFDPPFDVQSF